MVESLNRLRRPGYHWNGERPLDEPFPAGELFDAVNWLIQEQYENGQWAEDIWDTCEVARALISIGVPEDSPTIVKAIRFVRDQVDRDWPDTDSFWYGPGCLGAALTLVSQIDDQEYSQRIVDRIFEMQCDDGHFSNPLDGGRLVAPPEWHTACAIVGLYSVGSMPPRPERTQEAFDWLLARQDDSGSWGSGHRQVVSYTTRQAVIAMSIGGPNGGAAAQRGTEWFLGQWRDQRRGSTSRTILLCATAAIARTHRRQLYGSVNFLVLREIEDLLLTLDAERRRLHRLNSRSVQQSSEALTNERARSERLKQESDELQSQMDRYALRLTGNQVAVVSAVLALLGVALPIIFAIAS